MEMTPKEARELFRSGKPNLKHILKGIIKNPLIIGAVTGLLFSVFKIPIPQMIGKTINYVGNTW